LFPVVGSARRGLTRRSSGRYASAAATVFADSNYPAPGSLRGTRSAAELQVVRRRNNGSGYHLVARGFREGTMRLLPYRNATQSTNVNFSYP
jgi:hypothetical protein